MDRIPSPRDLWWHLKLSVCLASKHKLLALLALGVKEKGENLTSVLKVLRCMPGAASRCQENWETPTPRPSPRKRGGSPVGNSLAGLGFCALAVGFPSVRGWWKPSVPWVSAWGVPLHGLTWAENSSIGLNTLLLWHQHWTLLLCCFLLRFAQQ